MKLHSKALKSPNVVLVLVWPDFWKPCKEGEGKDASVSTDHTVLHALEDVLRTMPGLFTAPVALWARSLGTQFGPAQGPRPSTLYPCTWATFSLTASFASLPALDDVAINLFVFPGHNAWSSAPPMFPKACINMASLGAAMSEYDDCAGLGTCERKPGSPWIPLARATLPWEEWGSTQASIAPGVCDHAADLAASLYTFQCMAELISPSTTSQAASSLSCLSPER